MWEGGFLLDFRINFKFTDILRLDDSASSDDEQSDHPSSTTSKSLSSSTPKKGPTSSTTESTTHKLLTPIPYRPTLETPSLITSIKKPSSILTTTVSSAPHYLPSTHKPYEYDEFTEDVDYEYDDDYLTTNSKELLSQQNQSKIFDNIIVLFFFFFSFI